ncbi:hypothetical protein [Staphylococcus equorum]|nr:hypothetical protein [Staphylococcus equorum]
MKRLCCKYYSDDTVTTSCSCISGNRGQKNANKVGDFIGIRL